jgi:A/G-specific adenine glycosylase
MRALPVGDAPPIAGDWRDAGQVDHVFTHFALTLSIKICTTESTQDLDGEWWPVEDIINAGLPSLFQKAAIRAMETRA